MSFPDTLSVWSSSDGNRARTCPKTDVKGETTGRLPSSGHKCCWLLSAPSLPVKAFESEHLLCDIGIALIKLRFEQCAFKERP